MRWMLLVAALVAAGCPGELENPARFNACPPGAVETLLRQKCATAGCHSAMDLAAGLDLASTGVATRLVGQAAETGGACEGKTLIDPNDTSAAGSLLLDKLDGMPSCGNPMPFGAPPLEAADLTCIEQWVEDAVMAGGQ